MSELIDRGKAFHSAIAGFIESRKEAKLKGKEDDAETALKYEYGTWLADAARRVGQIQVVTHVLKATHPDARGSSLHVPPASLPAHREIGSHVLGEHYAEDVVGNAAALDVFKFLKVEVNGKRLLDWMQAGDADLQSALSKDTELAHGWMSAFASLVREDQQPSSHPMAKQVYWLIGEEPQDDAQYHLLQPMFSSSLEHVVHFRIKDSFWEEPNKSARKAKWDKKPSSEPFVDYRNIVGRKLGGSNKQNVSQLNSERAGLNYLLPSLSPPAWKQDEHASLLKRDSALEGFVWFEGVRRQLKELTKYLLSVQDEVGNMAVRNQRDALADGIVQQLAMFGATIQARHTPGWSRDEACRLPRCERLWLDPERSVLPVREDTDHPQWSADDLAFQQEYERGDWADEVAGRFGLWLNQRLRDRGLVTMAEPELRHWAQKAIIDVAWPAPMQRRARGGEA